MKKNNLLKVKASCTLLVLALAFFVTNVNYAHAGMPVAVTVDVPAVAKEVKDTIGTKILKALNTIGSKLLATTVRNTLNRVAMDAAKRVASSGEGQKPTYTVSELGGYWKNLGDAAAGDFIDSLGKDWGLDLCTPPDTNLQAKISLGLVQTIAPEAPDCTITKLVTNYSSALDKYEAMKTGDYLKAVQVSFDPSGSELGGALTLFGKTLATSTKAAENAKDKSIVTQGWVEKTNIAGKLLGTPGASKEDLSVAKNVQANGLLKSTGNILVDASNTFLNQLAYEGFQRVMREISKGKSDGAVFDATKLKDSLGTSLIQYGESVISEKLASVIKPRFDVRSDYSIVTDLASCTDKNNPGPTSCVIDDKFSQAISEKLTVGEALEKGYLHGDWLVSGDSKSDNTYTLRSASILRKYRIVPVGWEQAISVAAAKNYKATFNDLISCFDGEGQFSADFKKDNQSWCRGLVDPNWVLKAPTNSCAKQGYGNQIISSLVSQDANGLATLAITRAEDYCADDQTCIKEKTDGSCEVYGYCNEEKRTWKFGTDSCEPVFNTCQTFTSATDKQTASFLENTLDFSTCDQNNSGCKQYSYNGTYSSSTNTIDWNKNYSVFFNNKAVSCDASNEACTKLLRGKPGWADVNYVMDADFSLNSVDDNSATTTNWHWPIENGVGTIIDYNGSKALAIAGPEKSALYSNNDKNLLPKNLSPISGWSYTLSAEVKIVSGDKITMTLGDKGAQSEITGYDWKTISVTASNINNLDFKIQAIAQDANASFIIQNLKLTPNNYNPGFSNYATFPTYEKLLPNYLESSCYNSTSGTGDYTLKDNAPAVCSNFARKCNREEVGCELFTSVKDIFAVAAKANVNDYCDASCVGYNTYLAKASYFYGTSADNLIPENSTACNAESAGCASFTNLDAATSGGESVEYFAKVRQCIKPDTNSCGDFYSWDNAQLKVMSLKKDSNGNPFIVNTDEDAACTKDTYNLPITDPRYNADCRKIYSKSGAITYHIISNTVSCSDSCRTYRLNEKNIDKNALTQAACSGTWDSSQNVCYTCQNGGVWDTNQKACTYKAISSESTTCEAAEVGCREYNGNNGNSLKLMATYDFETGTDGFSVFGFGSASQSTESTVKNGHSLLATGGVMVNTSNFATENSAYTIKFMAKASSAVNGKIYFKNSSIENTANFNVSENNPQGNITFKGDNSWHVYEFNLSNLNHKIGTDESLYFTLSGNLLIDNIIVNEITDKYYLIQGSSQVPNVCYYDMSDVYQGPNYNLGCAAYTDRAGTTHNLHQFSELCQNSAVGCEQMIQTNDSSNYYTHTVNLNNSDKNVSCAAGTPGCIEVKGAQAIYAVFDSSKQCNGSDAGCSRFGYLKTVANTSTWVDSYKKVSPDAYDNDTTSPLCRSNEVGCDTWTTVDGAATYFKTPGLNTCVFKNNYWYKSQVKRCDANSDGKIADNEKVGAVCLTDADCSGKKCITDTNDYPCSTTYLKTIGLGGANGRVATPDGAVGLCNAQSAGCSEYIDPVSKYVNNLIYNPIAQKIDNVDASKWTSANGVYSQRVSIKPNKLYVLQVDGNDSVVAGNFSTAYATSGGTVRILKEDNTFSDLVTTASTTGSIIFNSGVNTYVTISRNSTTVNVNSPAATVSLKEAIVNYQLKDNIDTSSCNGLVNTDAGCVLFNARTQVGASGLKKNIWNATLTTESSAPSACGSADANCFNNANTVIKVSPDRVCSRWLDCQTYTEDPVTLEKSCYKVGECDKLNENNECASDGWLSLDGITRDITNSQNKNATGYALLNNWYLGGMKEVGQNTEAHFDFENTAVNLSCVRNLDVASGSALDGVKGSACTFDKNINESLVLSPSGSPTDYPAHGKGYLKVLNYYQISPLSSGSSIPVYTNQDYYINYLVNTKGSNAKAKLLITDDKGTNIKAKFTDVTSNGWERKVYKFNISDSATKQVGIKIYLTSDTNNLKTGYVYFDDINIEPVLQTGTNSYVAKDCRLYPGDDSMSCLSSNNNVIKDGLFGYCLQYDPMNPGVCLMWYPVDKISPITRSSQSTLGYSGKFPLYYCTEANGGFNLVEKRVGVFHVFSSNENDEYGGVYNNIGFDPYDYDTNCSDLGVSVESGTCECLNDTGSQKMCGSGYTAVFQKNSYEKADLNDKDYFLLSYCVPNQSALLIKSENKSVKLNDYSSHMNCKFSFNNGWSAYDGLLLIHDKVDKRTGNADDDSDIDGSNLLNINESTNTVGTEFDPIMVLNAGSVVESDLKYISNADPDKAYRISCNKLSKFVENDGSSISWTGRIGRSSIFSTSTPDFFTESFYHFDLLLRKIANLNWYGRSREDVPFGAAALTSDYDISNSEPLVLRNQYSKQLSETLFAGRPYGCNNGSNGGAGCANIGQCNLDPNVFCIYSNGNTDLNNKSCSAGGNGTCVPLWSVVPSETNAISVLNQIFVKKYSDLVYDKASAGYIPKSKPKSNNIFFKDVSAIMPASSQSHLITPPNGIVKVLPVITNEDFRLAGSANKTTISGTKAVINEAGLYQLSFNTDIDVEQQPMKQIIIDWGDGLQVVTNLDNKSEANEPHKFYHFYLKNSSYHLEIKVFDNWDAYKCSSMANNAWGTTCISI